MRRKTQVPPPDRSRRPGPAASPTAQPSSPRTAGVVTGLGAWFILRRLPGLTGDTYGALNELIEALLLVTLPVLVRWLPT